MPFFPYFNTVADVPPVEGESDLEDAAAPFVIHRNKLDLGGVSAIGHTHDWSDITGEPTTLGGYGITDGATDTELSDGLALKANAANPVFTGTVTIPDNALAIADTNGLQTALDGKQPLDAQLTSLAALSYAGNTLKVVRVNAGETDFELATVSGYTTEEAQDAVGAMVDTTLVYTDVTPLLSRAALTGHVTASAGSNTTALGSFTMAELNTAVSDGNVQYTDAQLTSLAALDYTGNTLKVIRVNAGETDFELATISGGSGLTHPQVLARTMGA